MSRRSSGHHSVYVVCLRDPSGDGRAGYYVGMTGLTPEARFQKSLAVIDPCQPGPGPGRPAHRRVLDERY